MARKINVNEIISEQRKYMEGVISGEGYPKAQEWAEDAFKDAQKILGIDAKLMPRWEWVPIYEMNDDFEEGITLGKFVPIDGVVRLNQIMFFYGTQEVIYHVVFHEMCHLAHMIDLLATKNNTSRKNKFVKWVTDECYAHGAAFKKFTKLSKYQDEVAEDWLLSLRDRQLINF